MSHAFCTVDWEKLVRVVSALLVPVIAGVTAYIAWQQSKNNKNQFRLALMERRSKVFNATGELIATILRQARINNDDLAKFLWETRETEFLFGSGIAKYLHELYEKAVDVYSLENAVDEQPRRQRVDALRWFSGQGDESKKKFGEYMAFRD
jgi:tRNA A-37 threonylcarbamoyl transferase component Bud32